MKDPNVITPALSDEELMEMSQKEYENPGWVDSDEDEEYELMLNDLHLWDGCE